MRPAAPPCTHAGAAHQHERGIAAAAAPQHERGIPAAPRVGTVRLRESALKVIPSVVASLPGQESQPAQEREPKHQGTAHVATPGGDMVSPHMVSPQTWCRHAWCRHTRCPRARGGKHSRCCRHLVEHSRRWRHRVVGVMCVPA